MRQYRREFLVFGGIVVALVILGVGMFLALFALARQTSQAAATQPAAQDQTLETRVALVFHPTPTVLPDPVTVIHEIRSLARLETIQYTLEKVITAQNNQNQLSLLFGDKLIFVGHGKVIAGIDLAKIRPEDMWVQNNVLYMRLPAAEIFVAALDNQKSYVYNRDTGLFTKGDVNLETTARQAAEKEIYQAALDDGILTQAQQNAESYMSRMMRGLGYADVIFVRDATPEPSTGQPATPTP